MSNYNLYEMKTDAEIKKDVLAELAWQPNIDETQIGVIVENGVVTLTGTVNDFTKKVAAQKAVKKVSGVTALAEDIEVKYGDNFKQTDQEIAKRIVSALEWNASVPQEKINVKVEDGHVYLTGELEWDYQKKAAKKTIENLQGVSGVINSIHLLPKTTPDDIVKRIEDAFERSADIDANNIKVSIDGYIATLTGTVKSLKEKDDAKRAVYGAPGITEVKNELKVQYYPIYM